MDVAALPIHGALKIAPRLFADERGSFKETYALTRYRAAGVDVTFVQENLSRSRKHVLRGLHADPRMAKLVEVATGAAYDVIVDIRRESPTYGKWVGVELRAAEGTQIFIPAGCLHGFLALEEDTLLTYRQSAEYDPASEIGIAWNDPDLAIAWPIPPGIAPTLSAKDAANPTLRESGR
jgi:dTDP-4-dehydrorhamnose 3,5-epimerase